MSRPWKIALILIGALSLMQFLFRPQAPAKVETRRYYRDALLTGDQQLGIAPLPVPLDYDVCYWITNTTGSPELWHSDCQR
jgi:hypothetical protein